MESQRIAIVGGGLVGSLLATFLVRRGHQVVVYEQRPDRRAMTIGAGRSINLIGTSRGLAALERVGLRDAVLAIGVPVRGRTMHALDGALSYHPYGKDDTEVNHSLPRGELNALLMTHAERAGATFHFRHRLREADLGAGRLEFENEETGESVRVEADRIVGADGAGSALRDAFAALPGFTTTFEDLGHGYKELVIPPRADGSFAIEQTSLHIWPRGRLMLMALPNQDGSFTVTLYLPNEGASSFAEVQGAEAVIELFEREFPDAIPLIPDLTADFEANPTGRLGTRRCEPFCFEDRAILIGDSAHAIVPFFGQGMNCGFEDCSVLIDQLEEHADWGRAFAAYSEARKPNADAIAAMSLENFIEMSERVGDAEFLLRRHVEHRLENELDNYRTRYSMVTYSHIPYRLAYEAGKIQQRILDELCRGIERPEDVDLERARMLIERELTPFLDRHAVSLAY